MRRQTGSERARQMPGKAVVSTPVGVEGIDPHGEEPFRVGADWKSFLAHVVELLESPETRRKVEESAARYSEKHLTMDAVYQIFSEEMEKGAAHPTTG